MKCIHQERIFKKHDSSGRLYCLKRCLKCGCSLGMCLKPKNIDEIEELTADKEEEFKNLRDELNQIKIEKFKEERKEERKKFFNDYSIYLKSEQWRKKREKVLKRDKFVCQACLMATATQVHHKTYEHLYYEPLFELVSICKECHENLHEHMK